MNDSTSTLEPFKHRPPKVTLENEVALSGFEAVASENPMKDQLARTQESDSNLPQWAWFMAGLFLLPLLVGVVSVSLTNLDGSGLFTSYSSNDPSLEEEASFVSETYAVRGFYMTSGFEDTFAAQSFWDLTFEADTWEAFISGSGSENKPGFDQQSVLDDNGNTWWVAEIQDQEWDFSVYITQVDNAVFVAYPPSSSEPTYAHYFWNNSGGIFDLSSLAVLIWPISAIAGVAWGFSKNQPAFAYGVMVWGSMVILVTGFIAFIGYAF